MTDGAQHDPEEEPAEGEDDDERRAALLGNASQRQERTEARCEEARLKQLRFPS